MASDRSPAHPATRRRLYLESPEAGGLSRINALRDLSRDLKPLECRLGLETLRSFPTTVALCTTNVCNARCTFCDYTPKPAGMADFMTLDDVRRMSWL